MGNLTKGENGMKVRDAKAMAQGNWDSDRLPESEKAKWDLKADACMKAHRRYQDTCEQEYERRVRDAAVTSPLGSLVAKYFAAVLNYEQAQSVIAAQRKLVTAILACTEPSPEELREMAEMQAVVAVDSPMEQDSSSGAAAPEEVAAPVFQEDAKVCAWLASVTDETNTEADVVTTATIEANTELARSEEDDNTVWALQELGRY